MDLGMNDRIDLRSEMKSLPLLGNAFWVPFSLHDRPIDWLTVIAGQRVQPKKIISASEDYN